MKNQNKKNYGIPVFDSLGQAASATRIPLRILKSAKRNGCPAFKSNRVFVPEFLEWHFARATTPETLDFNFEKARLTRAQAVTAERENKIADGELCTMDAVRAHLAERFITPLIRAFDEAPSQIDADWLHKVVFPAARAGLSLPQPKTKK